MKVGVTGHQEREGLNWDWVEQVLRSQLREIAPEKALSCLAAGTDQLFAEVALGLGVAVVAVVPLDDYERHFDDQPLAAYRRLLTRCEKIELGWRGDPERGFLEAGKFIVNACDLMFAVWDGKRAEGLGGTADIVTYAQFRGRPIVHLNPFTEIVSTLLP